MPVVTVTAPALSSPEAETRALSAVACEVAGALGLEVDEVQVSCVHSSTGVLGRRSVAPWPVVVIHGRPRPPDRMAAATQRARSVVAAEWQCVDQEVWVHWLVAT